MRNLLIITGLTIAAATFMTTHAGSMEATVETSDSSVAVIGWFNRRDTLTYWINEAEWKIKGSDTIKNAGVSTKVMVTVTDSTSDGYAMEYKFLEFHGDSLADTELGNFQNRIADKIGKRIVGTTIKFHTDEYGSIVKFDNLKQIKKQAKSLFKESMKELMSMPVMDSLKSIGFDIAPYIKRVDTDQLVEGYVEELRLLFLCHGTIYDTGESTIHEDETDSQYASDTYTAASVDNESGIYTITCQVDNHIPQEALKSIVGALVENMSDERVQDSFNRNFDSQVQGGTMTSYYGAVYFPDGWPSDVIKQTKVTVGGTTKTTQTYITWDYRSVGHPN